MEVMLSRNKANFKDKPFLRDKEQRLKKISNENECERLVK